MLNFQLREEYGYTVIDALDASQDMLDCAKEKDLYRHYLCCMIGDGHVVDIQDSMSLLYFVINKKNIIINEAAACATS